MSNIAVNHNLHSTKKKEQVSEKKVSESDKRSMMKQQDLPERGQE